MKTIPILALVVEILDYDPRYTDPRKQNALDEDHPHEGVKNNLG